jgi:transcriptional antiterminator
MGRKDSFKQLDRLHTLVKLKSTGSPKELALKLGVSERTVYRLLNDLSDIHAIEVSFSYLHNSYTINS